MTQLAVSLSAVVFGVIGLPEVSGGEYALLSLLAWFAVAGLLETMSGGASSLRVLPTALLGIAVTIVLGTGGAVAMLGAAALIHGGAAMMAAMRLPITKAAEPARTDRKDTWAVVNRKPLRGAVLENQSYPSADDRL
jgi:hypothetical protein